MSSRAVQGLLVKSTTLTSKKNRVKLVLEAEKDDIRAGAGTFADVLTSLEFHSTGADSSPVSVGLNSNSFEFTVLAFQVRQDSLSVILEGVAEDGALNSQILGEIATHSAGNTPVELVMAG